jgi:hypothetical protein
MSDGGRKGGVGCGGGCLIIILFLIFFPRARDFVTETWDNMRSQQQQEVREEKRADVEAEAAEWLRAEEPELQRAIDDLQTLHDDRAQRIEALRSTLEAVRDDPENDPDLSRARKELAQVAAALEELKQRRLDAFVQFRKIEAGRPSEAEKELLRESLQKGRNAARDAQERLESLRGK